MEYALIVFYILAFDVDDNLVWPIRFSHVFLPILTFICYKLLNLAELQSFRTVKSYLEVVNPIKCWITLLTK
jgi:hypothetical protein